jgi:CRP-like cAMP-binding protein
MRPGDYVGEMSLIDNELATVMAEISFNITDRGRIGVALPA